MNKIRKSIAVFLALILIGTSGTISSNHHFEVKAFENNQEGIKVLQFEGNIETLNRIVEGSEITITQELFGDKAQNLTYEDWHTLFNIYDIVLFPGGVSSKQFNGLGELGREALKDYVKSGGNYMGICAGAFLASRQRLGIANIQYEQPYFSGIGELEIEMEEEANNIFLDSGYKYPSKRIIEMVNGPVWNVTVPDGNRSSFKTIASFSGLGQTSKYSGDTFKGKPAIVSDTYGSGDIILFSAHPDVNSSLGNKNMIVESFRWLNNNKNSSTVETKPLPDVEKENSISVGQFEGNVDAIKQSVFGSSININEIKYEDKGSTWTYDQWSDLFGSFEVVIFPPDSSSKQYNGLGENGRLALRDYINNGGGYLGISSGAFLASNQKLNLVNIKYGKPYFSGNGVLEINMTSVSDNIFSSSEYKSGVVRNMRMYNGPVWEVLNLNQEEATYKVVANFSGGGSTSSYSGTTFENRPAIISDTLGNGKIVLFSGSPYSDYYLGNQGMIKESIEWISNKKQSENSISAPTTQEEYINSLTADFEYRDSLPETNTPESDWFKYSSWGPSASIYPEVTIPKGVDPVEWKIDRIIEVAKKYIGVPYNHSHIPTLGFDCSNYTSWVYNYGLGIKFSSGITRQSESAGRMLTEGEEFKKGDLLFISNSSGTAIVHVVIYIDKDSIIDSTIDSIDGVAIRGFKGWYKDRFSFARRIIE